MFQQREEESDLLFRELDRMKQSKGGGLIFEERMSILLFRKIVWCVLFLLLGLTHSTEDDRVARSRLLVRKVVSVTRPELLVTYS